MEKLERRRAATREDFEIPNHPPSPLFADVGAAAGGLPGGGWPKMALLRDSYGLASRTRWRHSLDAP